MKLRASFIFKNPLSKDLVVERNYGLTDEQIVDLLRVTLSRERDNFISFSVEFDYTIK